MPRTASHSHCFTTAPTLQVSNTLLPSGSMLSPVKDVCDMLTTMSINLVRGGSALQDLMEEVRPGGTGHRHDAAT